MDVLYEGYLEKCLSPDEAKREWRRRYFVLRKALGSGTQTLEYFKDKDWRKQEPKGVLTLFSGYATYKVVDAKKKFTFEVKTMDNFFVLSASNEESREKWIEVLQQSSSVHSFAVAVEETAKSSELGLKHKEPCTLQITCSTVLLVLESSIPISWPFNCIRRYKCHPGSFLLEVGRKAPTGEGVFCFYTQEGQDIFEVLGKTVANRMSSKQDQSKSDTTSPTAASSSQTNEIQGFQMPSGIAGKQNPFLDFTGGGGGGAGEGEGVRFVMKRRSPSPPLQTPIERPRTPPKIENEAASYSHLKYKNEKPFIQDTEGDYDQLARAKECTRFNRTRLSESNKPGPSSSKALKVLGLLRSNSAENVQPAESSNAESCDLYSHLEFDRSNMKKSQSTSNILDNGSSHTPGYSQTNIDSSQSGDIYNQLNSDMRKRLEDLQNESTYNVLRDVSSANEIPNTADGAYDKLGARNAPVSHRHARPEPIIVTDDNYNSIGIAREQVDQNSIISKQARSHFNAYEEPTPLTHAFPDKVSHVNNEKGRIPENRPPLAKPGAPLGAKPAIQKKPVPLKPPRATHNEDSIPESGKDVGPSRTKVGGNEFRDNLISQLKKNFEFNDQGNPKYPTPPFSPSNSTKKLVEPFYAVSPFASGNKPTQAVSSEYDVPSNNTPRFDHPEPENKQQLGFTYAVSPFHSANQKSISNLDQNLYDTPSPQNRQHGVANALNTYDVPVQRPVVNAAENLYDTPNQQNVLRMPQLKTGTKERSPVSDRSMQFTYAVSPFAGARNNASQIKFQENRSAGNISEEAAYCEVPEVMAGHPSFDGYDPVGGILHSGRPPVEPLYADPRD